MLRRFLLAVALLLSSGVVVLVAAGTADATTPPPAGRIDSAVLDTFSHRLQITGWAYDPTHPISPISVGLLVNGVYVGNATANRVDVAANRTFHLRGQHGFSLVVTWTRTATNTAMVTRGAGGGLVLLNRHAVSSYLPPAGDRIVAIAKQFVGRVPYVDGGTSPTSGFDCSGYTQYAYAAARVAQLPRTADQQRHAPGMRIITASAARPGDLVFYLSGSYVYHVAIYAGNGMQYAAATPQDGIRYQIVWSSDVLYGTDWH